nr:hypothetical protein, 36K - Anabaena sp. insertion sequence IS891 [Anabaena sp.]
MLVFETKLEGTNEQYQLLMRRLKLLVLSNACLRTWIGQPNIGRYDLSAYCAVLLPMKTFRSLPNSTLWLDKLLLKERGVQLLGFLTIASKTKPGRKVIHALKKNRRMGVLSIKLAAGSLVVTVAYVTFSDGFKAGTFKLWGTRDLHFYQLKQFKRVRVVRRADGYYAQFCIDQERVERREPTLKTIGLDVGLNHFLTDSEGNTVENPRHLRKSEKSLKRLQRRLSKTKKGSNNRVKARNRLSRKHLKVSRQRKDFAVKLARCVVQSSDLVAYEDLQVRNMVRNRHLAKSISDARGRSFGNGLSISAKCLV